MYGHYCNETQNYCEGACEEYNSSFDSGIDSDMAQEETVEDSTYHHDDNKPIEIKVFPFEIKQLIFNFMFSDILLLKRKEHKLKMSKQSIVYFTEYSEMEIFRNNIDWDKYRIGDVVLYKGNTTYAWREKKMYIRGWCIKCKGPNNDLESLCGSCESVERDGGMAILADTGYKICINCYERFKYIDYHKDTYCKWCLDTRIFLLNKQYANNHKKKPDKKKICIKCKEKPIVGKTSSWCWQCIREYKKKQCS